MLQMSYDSSLMDDCAVNHTAIDCSELYCNWLCSDAYCSCHQIYQDFFL